MSASALIGLAAVWACQVAIPGPSFIRVTHLALAVSRPAALKAALGVAAGNCIWCLAAMLGVGAVASSGPAARAVLLIGAAYLAWSSLQLVLAGIRRPAAGAALPESELPEAGGWPALRIGLLTSLTNPQTAIFFATLFVAFFPPNADIEDRLLALPVIAGVTMAWYLTLTAFLSRPDAQSAYLRLSRWLDLAFGAVLALLSLRLLVAGLASL